MYWSIQLSCRRMVAEEVIVYKTNELPREPYWGNVSLRELICVTRDAARMRRVLYDLCDDYDVERPSEEDLRKPPGYEDIVWSCRLC